MALDTSPVTSHNAFMLGIPDTRSDDMNTRDDMIREITEGLGNEATREEGAVVFDWLRANGHIQWDDRAGFVMDDDIDVVGAYNLATWPTAAK
jgi:hypothetical protein